MPELRTIDVKVEYNRLQTALDRSKTRIESFAADEADLVAKITAAQTALDARRAINISDQAQGSKDATALRKLLGVLTGIISDKVIADKVKWVEKNVADSGTGDLTREVIAYFEGL